MSKTILPMMIAALLFVGASLPLQNASAHFCIEVDGIASVEAATYLPPYLVFPGGTCGVNDCGDGNFHDHTVVPGDLPTLPPPPLSVPPTDQEISDFIDWALGLDRAAFDGCYGDKEAPGNCATQATHNYGSGSSAGAESTTAQQAEGLGLVTVWHANANDCNGDGVPGGWDGDYENGIGGGFFGWGPWANSPICDYDLNVHGGSVAVNDGVFGPAISFFVGEGDQGGPVIITDPVTGAVIDCETDGGITPDLDSDDCLSDADGDATNGRQPYTGVGSTCGPGGGDGGFWVFLDGVVVTQGGNIPPPPPPSVTTNNPPTAGTITAF